MIENSSELMLTVDARNGMSSEGYVISSPGGRGGE